jgi:uncharacterized protein
MQHTSLFIQTIPDKGKGVFTKSFIAEGIVIEIAPMLVLPENDKKLIDKTHLYNYYFLWGIENKKIAIALGYGSIYNHSFQPNVAYKMDFENETITFVAWRNILPNEELLINYNGDEDNTNQLWFDVK